MKFPTRKLFLLSSMLTSIAAVLHNQFRNPLPRIFPGFHRWSKFRRHFVQNLLIGIAIELLVLALLHFRVGPAVDFQNYVLDAMMKLSADTNHPDAKVPPPTQLFIDVDEKTYRSDAWGNEPGALPLNRIAQLIELAAANGARFVLVDFAIDGPGDERQTEFISRMEGILKQNPGNHLLFVRTMRQPLELRTAKSIRPSTLDALIEKHPDQVHAVAPNFLRSSDHVLRHWRLWESACRPLPRGQGQPGEGRWVIVPSPQLVIAAVAKGLALPSAANNLTCAVDGAESEVLETAESGRMADWFAGRWVWENFGTCYQQDSFKAKNCRDATPPDRKKTTQEMEGEELANRILFLRSDWVRKNAEGASKGTTPNDPHFSRLAAINLLQDSPSGPVAAAFEKMRTAAQNKALTVAVIGASYRDSRDTHLTPLGEMPGALVLVNAIDTMQTTGILQSPPTSIKLFFVVLMLVGISAAFAVLSALWASVLMLAIIGLTMLPLSLWFLRQGIWLDFGAPLMGIYFHRAWEDLLEKRSRKASATRKDEEHVTEK